MYFVAPRTRVARLTVLPRGPSLNLDFEPLLPKLRDIFTRDPRRPLSEQHRGKSSPIPSGQRQEGSGERGEGVGLLRFPLIGANTGANCRLRRRIFFTLCNLRCVFP